MTTFDARITAAIAVNLSYLRHFLSDAVARSSEALDLIHRGERDQSLGVLLGLDVLVDDCKALLGATRVLHQTKATCEPRTEGPPFVFGLLTPEDLVYVRKLLEAEDSLQEESQHLPGEMPQDIRARIIFPSVENPRIDGSQVSPAQIDRLSQHWSQIAGEPVQAECLDYAFITRCTELAALRLERQYNDRPKAQAINSQNLGGWVFLLERHI